jgi:hypothetical protein
LWEVRYARFDGDVDERAEEWRVTVDGRGSVRQIRHALPESRLGARLSREEALVLARKAVNDRFDLDPSTLKDVGAEEQQLPARADWAFTFAEPLVDVGTDGEARILVTVAGDEVAGYGRYVHVPESWLRAERELSGKTLFLRMVLAGVLGLAGLVALIMAVQDWTHRRRDRRALLAMISIVVVMSAIGVANSWPVLAMNFRTTESIATQAGFAVAAALAGGVVAALLLGLAAGVGSYAAARERPLVPASRAPAWVSGIAAACFVAGVGAIAAALLPQSLPLWPAFGVESLALPWLGSVLAGIQVLYATVVAVFLLHWFGQLTAAWRRRGWLTAFIVIAIFATLGLGGSRDAAVAGAIGALAGSALVAVVYGTLRFDSLSVPAFVATGAVLEIAEGALRAGYPRAMFNSAISIGVTVAVAWAATRYLRRAREAAAAAVDPPTGPATGP